jgi:prolyl-tRNA editing enzyme YbaK/EbsC (Cys-tRNA(Pro) deacylase)
MKTAVDVHNYLLERDIPHEMVPSGGRVRSPKRAAAVLGLDPEQVGRVVLFESEGGIVAAVIPADRSPDPDLVRSAAGDQLSELTPDRSTDLTEFLPEALPPVALPPGTTVLVDRGLAGEEVLYLPGGEATSVLKIRGEDLLRATDARVAPLVS